MKQRQHMGYGHIFKGFLFPSENGYTVKKMVYPHNTCIFFPHENMCCWYSCWYSLMWYSLMSTTTCVQWEINRSVKTTLSGALKLKIICLPWRKWWRIYKAYLVIWKCNLTSLTWHWWVDLVVNPQLIITIIIIIIIITTIIILIVKNQ